MAAGSALLSPPSDNYISPSGNYISLRRFQGRNKQVSLHDRLCKLLMTDWFRLISCPESVWKSTEDTVYNSSFCCSIVNKFKYFIKGLSGLWFWWLECSFITILVSYPCHSMVEKQKRAGSWKGDQFYWIGLHSKNSSSRGFTGIPWELPTSPQMVTASVR